MRVVSMGVLALLASAGVAAAEFRIAFDWGDIPLCTNGRPNKVGSPQFALAEVPPGTTRIDFKLKDLNAPRYNHGGGKVTWTGGNSIPFGAFSYKSPCPPGEVHTYEWTATARKGNKKLATAKARRQYPE
ncbi:MAG: hypothetical protein QNJ16_05725 [Rhodobacter sp.]|nr:hypothetical protein [Rhodobacter sp.]